MTVWNLEVLRWEVVRWVGAEVDGVEVGGCLRLSSGVIPALRADGVGAAVRRS